MEPAPPPQGGGAGSMEPTPPPEGGGASSMEPTPPPGGGGVGAMPSSSFRVIPHDVWWTRCHNIIKFPGPPSYTHSATSDVVVHRNLQSCSLCVPAPLSVTGLFKSMLGSILGANVSTPGIIFDACLDACLDIRPRSRHAGRGAAQKVCTGNI